MKKNTWIGIIVMVAVIAVAFFVGRSWIKPISPAINSNAASSTPTIKAAQVPQSQSVPQPAASANYSPNQNDWPGPKMTAAQEADYATYFFNSLSNGDVSSADCTNLEGSYGYPMDSLYFGLSGGIIQGDSLYAYSKHRCLGYVATYYEVSGGIQIDSFYHEQIIDLATNSALIDRFFQQSLPADPSITYKRLSTDAAVEYAMMNGPTSGPIANINTERNGSTNQITFDCADARGYEWQMVSQAQTPLFLMWNKLQELNGY